MCKGVEVLGSGTSGVLPEEAPMAPVGAIKILLDQTEISLSKVAFIELMEAYAAQAILCTRLCGLDLDKVNIRGGALSQRSSNWCFGRYIDSSVVSRTY